MPTVGASSHGLVLDMPCGIQKHRRLSAEDRKPVSERDGLIGGRTLAPHEALHLATATVQEAPHHGAHHARLRSLFLKPREPIE